jgi:hypothetical protein
VPPRMKTAPAPITANSVARSSIDLAWRNWSKPSAK